MESFTLLLLRCFSNHEDVSITGEFFDLLSNFTYDGEGEVAWPEYLHDFISMLHEEDYFSDEQDSLMVAYTLRESPFHWLFNLPTDTMHSFEHFCDLVEDMFHHFDPDHLDRKMLQKWRALHESVIDFWQRFCDL